MGFRNFVTVPEAKILAAMSSGYQPAIGLKQFCEEGNMRRAWLPSELITHAARKLMTTEVAGKKFFFQELKFIPENTDWEPRSYERVGSRDVPKSNIHPKEQKQANAILDAVSAWDLDILNSICEEKEVKAFFAKLGVPQAKQLVSMENKVIQEGISLGGVFNEDSESMSELRRDSDEKKKLYDNAMTDTVSFEELERQVNTDIDALNEQIKATGGPNRKTLADKRDALLALLQKKRNATAPEPTVAPGAAL